MINSQIADGEKYALVAVPRLPLDWRNMPQAMELSPGLGFFRRLPFTPEQHWREWIGTVRADQLAKASLILIAKSSSNNPKVLDGENEQLIGVVGRFYQGLQLATPIWIEGDVVRLTGANCGGDIDIRQVSTLNSPASIHYGHIDLIGTQSLQIAAKLIPILNGFPKGEYLRLCRVLNAFFSGIVEKDLRERLHQFCRCIEGLILADPGQTTKQFKSRTELFVGPSLHDFMGNLYENRSAVEHMNDPILAAISESGRRQSFEEMTLVSEEIARYSLLNILLKPDLLKQYRDEVSLAAFWKIKDKERINMWGTPFDVVKLRKEIGKRRKGV